MYSLAVVDSDPLDCLFHWLLVPSSRHIPPSMITIQMNVSDRNFTTPEHMIAVWTKHMVHVILYPALPPHTECL